jgi:Putative adhesin
VKSRSVAVAALTAGTALTASATSGCGIGVHFADYRHVATVADAHVAGPMADVRLDAGDGRVTVTAGGAGSVTIRRVVYYQSGTPRPGQRLSGGTLTFNAGCSRCRVDYELVVPASVRLWLRTDSGLVKAAGVAAADVGTGSGSVTVRHVRGAVSARSDSGSLTVDDVAGAVTAATDSGSIHTTALRSSTVTASSDSGSIHLDFTVAPANVKANADSGSLHVTVPGGPYAIDVRTDSGGKYINVPVLSTASSRLDLRTDSGSVHVDPA